MAKIKSFTDASGVEHDQAYWRISNVFVDTASKRAAFTFVGYADQDKRNAGKQPIPGATKSYSVSGADFDSLYAQEIAKTLNMMQIGYKLATDTKDVVTGYNEADGTPIKVSFFDGAEDLV